MGDCDTLVVLPSATADGSLLFAKNSDREMNEALDLVFVKGGKGGKTKCTYMEVDMGEGETLDCLLCKPFWTFGAEMGVNQYGVAIGNEAIFTSKRAPYITTNENVLLGMDILRLTLERAKFARDAVRILTEIHEKYDQGGNAHFSHNFYYHNAYLIADEDEAWIVETAGRDWVCKRVTTTVASISNYGQIGSDWDMSSARIAAEGKDGKVHFAATSNDKLITFFGHGKERQCRAMDFLYEKEETIRIPDIFSLLRDHGTTCRSNPTEGFVGSDICMHFGFGPVRANRTTGSMIVQMKEKKITIWVTGTGGPCTSIYKPIWFDCLQSIDLRKLVGPTPSAEFNKDNLWWKHELLHRTVLLNYETRIKLFKDERDQMEQSFLRQAELTRHMTREKRVEFIVASFTDSWHAEENWFKKVLQHANSKEGVTNLQFLYAMKLNHVNKKAKIDTLVPKATTSIIPLPVIILIVLLVTAFVTNHYFMYV